MTVFTAGTDYNANLSDIINELFATMTEDGVMLGHAERVKQAELVIEDYVSVAGTAPPAPLLDRLSTYILKEDKSGDNNVAHRRQEYPVLSTRQYIERLSREASLQRADNYDSLGINRTPRTRTNRINDELNSRRVK